MGIKNISNIKSVSGTGNTTQKITPYKFIYKTDDMLVPAKIWIPEETFFSTSDETVAQIQNMAKLPVVYDHIVLTPDAHAGYGVPIGGVMALYDSVSPGGVGKDIGCGMLAVPTNMDAKELDKKRERIMEILYESIPVGFAWQQQKQDVSALDIDVVKDLYWARVHFKDSKEPYISMVSQFMGTLGGGNHFLELQVDEDGRAWIMIHSGSRNLGQQIADYYEEIAEAKCRDMGVNLADPALAYLSTKSPVGQEYLESMNFALEFARLNREHMLSRVEEAMKRADKRFTFDGDIINKHHNYADTESWNGINVVVHRKGAIKVSKGELGIIPGSMDTGSYIVEGLGNADAFDSASHGAGRRMSRGAAARSLDWEQVKKNLIKRDVLIYKGGVGDLVKNWPRDMENKRTKRIMRDAISETEKGYKNIQQVLDWERDIVKPIIKLTPRATLKG